IGFGPPGTLVVAGGGPDIARIGPDGLPDPTFGNNGCLDLFPDSFDVRDLVVHSDGTVYLLATDDSNVNGIGIGRITEDGQPDATFGGGDGLALVTSFVE